MVAQHNKLMVASGYSLFGLLGLKRFRTAEEAAAALARAWLERIGLVADADRPAGELPYGRSAGWRSPAPCAPSRGCSASTSLPPA